MCPPLVVTRVWETQAGPRRKHSEAEVLEGGGRWQPPSQKGSSWEGAVLEGFTCLQGYGIWKGEKVLEGRVGLIPEHPRRPG